MRQFSRPVLPEGRRIAPEDVLAPRPGPTLQALWQEAKGDWHAAHAIAQAQDDAEGAWVHAYLHRVEGDLANAGYWYRRAGRPAPNVPLQEEGAAVVAALLAG